MYPACYGQPVTVTATGLPWAVPTSGTNLSFAEHLQVNYGACGGITLNVDGTVTGSYNNTTHTFTAQTTSPRLTLSYMGSTWDWIQAGATTTWKDATNQLNLT
jgi:hypothetical protein